MGADWQSARSQFLFLGLKPLHSHFIESDKMKKSLKPSLEGKIRGLLLCLFDPALQRCLAASLRTQAAASLNPQDQWPRLHSEEGDASGSAD
ncbi:hypothetical protein E5093_14550 [Acinetobacter indicus]|uniref:hypothetical protein n=1 Tax=Acinetobacter indicus TaxID=756892 RepID=UPI00159F509F|nr:hypothetical protein [Acinetobacter indicus]QLB60675.1 hypothetical protein E5093_14550 [Acinetobacter indicus]